MPRFRKKEKEGGKGKCDFQNHPLMYGMPSARAWGRKKEKKRGGERGAKSKAEGLEKGMASHREERGRSRRPPARWLPEDPE